MEYLFIGLWVISPLALIPLLIVYIFKNSNNKKLVEKHQKQLLRLLNEGKITHDQYIITINSIKAPPISQANTMNYQNNNNYNNNYINNFNSNNQNNNLNINQNLNNGNMSPNNNFVPPYPPPINTPINNQINQPIYKPQNQPPINNYNQVQPMPNMNSIPAQYQKPIKKKNKSDFNAVNIILIVGVFFVILAGLIFATTTWRKLPDGVKTIVILAVTFIFYDFSILAEKKFNLKKTGTAFYILGSIFLPITIISVGFFELFGKWLSLDGNGKFTLFFFAVSSLGISTFLGAKKYKLIPFAWTALFSTTVSFMCIIKQFQPSNDIFALTLAIYSGAIIFLFEWIIKKNKDTNSIIISSLKAFSIINTIVLSLFSTIISTESSLASLPTIIFSLVFLKSIFNKSKENFGAYPYAIFMVLGLFKLFSPESSSQYLFVITCVAIISTLLALMNVYNDSLKKLLNIFSAFFSLFAFLFGIGSFVFTNDWNITAVITIFMLVLNTTWLAYKSKNKLIFYVQTTLTILFLEGLSSIITQTNYQLCVLLSILILAAFWGYRKIKAFNTRFSDIAFSTIPLICGIIPLYYTVTTTDSIASLICMIILSIIIAIIAFEKELSIISKVYCYLAPISLILITTSVYFISESLNSSYNSFSLCFFIFLVVLTAGAIACTIINKKHYITKRLIFPTEITAIVVGGLLFFQATFFDSYIFPYLWVLTLLLVVKAYYKYKDENIESFKLYSIFAGSISLLASYITTLNYTTNEMVAVLVATILSVISFIGYIYLKEFLKKDTHLTKLLLSFSAISMSIMASIMAIVFNSHDSLLIYGFVCIIVGALSYLAFYLRKNNILAIAPMFILFNSLNDILFQIKVENLGSISFFKNYDRSVTIVSLIVFFSIALIARKIHKKVYTNDKNTILIDWLTIFNIITIFFIEDNKYQPFILFIILAIYLLLYYKRTKNTNFNFPLLTVSCLFGVFAYWTQPFFNIPNIIKDEIYIIPVVIFCFALQKIWKGYNKQTDLISFITISLSTLYLSISAIISQKLVDALILGCLMLIMLIISFVMKRKKWFILSTCVLVFLSIYLSRSFWLSLAWWIYLLAVGIILITIAAINEVKKQKGDIKKPSFIKKYFK